MQDKKEKEQPESGLKDHGEETGTAEKDSTEIKNAHAAGSGAMERHDQELGAAIEKEKDPGLKGGEAY